MAQYLLLCVDVEEQIQSLIVMVPMQKLGFKAEAKEIVVSE
jgi:hypothetical protein